MEDTAPSAEKSTLTIVLSLSEHVSDLDIIILRDTKKYVSTEELFENIKGAQTKEPKK